MESDFTVRGADGQVTVRPAAYNGAYAVRAPIPASNRFIIIIIMKTTRVLLTLMGLFFLLLQPAGAVTAVTSAHAQSDAPLALVLTFDGAITPALTQYLERGIRAAEQQSAEVLILQLNTPGGSIDTMNDIVQVIRQSDIPVAVYVTPRGAMAASAGAVITLAGQVSAMAPETVIGAASPVGTQGEDLGQTMKEKVSEIILAGIRTMSERRGEKAMQLAEEMVINAKAVSATEALDAGLVDFIATDVDDLLTQMDGFTVTLESGERTLNTAGAQTSDYPMNFIEQLLQILINPNIVFLLLTIGVQAILIELSSPGGWVAGFTGAVCLLLAAYGLGVLPVNWFGILFLIAAFVLFIMDIKAPTHGALTAAGVASLIIGALVLFNTPTVTPPSLQVSVPLVILVSLATGLMFAVIVAFGIHAQRAPARMGQESLPDQTGIARTDINPQGQVQVASELWTAELSEGSEPVNAGDPIEVVSAEGVRLKIRKKG
jgi:membrane-bound serine protease (ClpP class)